jgi:hypothetical protein
MPECGRLQLYRINPRGLNFLTEVYIEIQRHWLVSGARASDLLILNSGKRNHKIKFADNNSSIWVFYSIQFFPIFLLTL